MFYSNNVPTRRQLWKGIAGYDIPLCPHIDISEGWIAKTYDRDCWMYSNESEDKHKCSQCDGFRCNLCESGFLFKFRKITPRSQVFEIGIQAERHLGPLKDINDPVWLSQLAITKSPVMQRRWSTQISNILGSCYQNLHLDMALMRSELRPRDLLSSKITLGDRLAWVEHEKKLIPMEEGEDEAPKVLRGKVSRPFWWDSENPQWPKIR